MICIQKCSVMKSRMISWHVRMTFLKCIAFVSTIVYNTLEQVYVSKTHTGDDEIWQKQRIYMQG